MRVFIFLLAFCFYLILSVPGVFAQTSWDLIRLMRLNAEGNRAYQAGDYPKAVSAFEEALEITQGPRLRGDQLAVIAKANLGSGYQEVGRFDEAETLLLDAYRTMGRLRTNDPKRLSIANNLASLYTRVGKYSAAEPIFVDVLDERRQRFGANDPETLVSMGNLARIYRPMGRLKETESLATEALRSREAVLGHKHPHTLLNMTGLAMIYQDMGRFADAEALYLRALSLADEVRGAFHPDTIVDQGNLALLHQRIGRFEEAEELHLRIVADSRAVFGPTHPDTLSALNNLAGLYVDTGRLVQAAPIFEEVLEAVEARTGPENPDTLNSKNNLGLSYLGARRIADAEALFTEVIETGSRVLGARHPIVLASVRNLGGVRDITEDLDDAVRLHGVAVSGLVGALGAGHPTTISATVDHASALLRRGEPEDVTNASYLLQAALTPWAEYVNSELGAGASDVQRQTLGRERSLLDSSIAVALRHPEHAELGARALLISKGVAGEKDATLSRLLATSPNRRVKQIAEELRGAEGDLHASYQTENPERVSAALARRNAARRALFDVISPPAILQPNAARPKKIVDTLGENEIFLDYGVYNSASHGMPDASEGQDRIVLAAYSRRHGVRILDLGPVAEITDEILRTTDYKTNRDEDLFADHWRLRNALLDPVADLMSDVGTVIVSPDGILARVNFSLLQDPEDHGRHLLERLDMRVVPTGRALLAGSLHTPAPRATFLGVGLTDFGPYDPARCGTSPSKGSRHGLCPLETPLEEVAGIQDLFDRAGAEPRQLLLNDSATEAAVVAQMPETRFIHLATHGGQELAGYEGVGLHNVGLAFHGLGVEPRGNGATFSGNDGILSGYEAARLQLFGTELVAMSACDTALGDAAGAEGIWSMAYAFRIAGAENVLMTLWSIDDQRAPEFMQQFYATLLSIPDDGGSRNDAMRNALRETVEWAIHNNWNYWDYGPYVLVES